ncbi:MAG TPA: TolC family protein [Bacteroidales bacterium]
MKRACLDAIKNSHGQIHASAIRQLKNKSVRIKQKKLLLSVFFSCLTLLTFASGGADSSMQFSLEQAKQYALENSPLVKSAALDLEAAKKKIWETTAIGLPQASAKYSYSYILTLPAIYEQFAQMGGGNTSLDDMKKSSTLDITVTQLLFSGAYLVGLQTSRVYKGLSELSLTKSKNDLNESVTNAYLLVLIAKENKKILDTMYNNMNALLETIKAMNSKGFVEETDVDQFQITVNTVKNNLELVTNQVLIAERMLKYQLGYPFESAITLTDSINGFVNNININTMLAEPFQVENNVDYKLVETQTKLMKLNLKLNKSEFLPDIAAFYQHDKNFNDKAVSFTPPDLVGLTINIPIFSSGQRLAKVSQARISYEKAKISQDQTAKGLRIQFEDNKAKYINALGNYESSKSNYALAEKIYNRSITKYKAGMISSSDLTQVQNQYLQAQTNYFSAILDLTSAKSKIENLISSVK